VAFIFVFLQHDAISTEQVYSCTLEL